MKKLLIVLLALAMISAFAACGQQESPAETDQSEATTVLLEEGLPIVTLNPDAVSREITEEMAAHGIVAFYENGAQDGKHDLLLYHFTDAAGKSAEEFAQSFAEDVHGCVKAHPWNEEDDTPCWQVVFFSEVDGEHIVDLWIMDGAEYPVAYGFPFHVEEKQLAGTPLYMWMPVDYAAEEVTEEQAASDVIAFYKDTCGYLADLTVYNWAAADWNYEHDSAAWSNEGRELHMTEEQFNELLTDGVTLEDIKTYFIAQGGELSEQIDYEKDGLAAKGFEYQEEQNGAVCNYIVIDYLIDGQFYELFLCEPTDECPGLLKAYLDAVHLK